MVAPKPRLEIMPLLGRGVTYETATTNALPL